MRLSSLNLSDGKVQNESVVGSVGTLDIDCGLYAYPVLEGRDPRANACANGNRPPEYACVNADQ